MRTAPLCFTSRGFSLHAATRIAGPDRRGLERLCRYVARPALAGGRLRILDADHLSFALTVGEIKGHSLILELSNSSKPVAASNSPFVTRFASLLTLDSLPI